MKKSGGWVRGHACGKKNWRLHGYLECALCVRCSDEAIDLCFPVDPVKQRAVHPELPARPAADD